MDSTRRTFLMASAGLTSMSLTGYSRSAFALPRAERDRLTPAQVLDLMKAGNERFRSGVRINRDFLREQRDRASGQYPAAVILSCIDSRAPVEIIMDFGIGDVFNSRMAGNVANSDVIGGLEFACQVAGAKVVLVLGHTACGAVAGAIDGVKLGNLTGLLARIQPAVTATAFTGTRVASNPTFVNAVARTNVELTLKQIRQDSAVLAGLEASGAIMLAGAMYDLATAAVSFVPR